MSGSVNNVLWRIIGRLAFNRITVIGKQNLPQHGPVLFVATHRNGALDAAPYQLAVPNAIPMVSAQLHRLPLGRYLFHGIAVARAKDKARGIQADNDNAMQQCMDLLKQGGQLFIMPEGTSTLGPKHLPFHRGAARIASAAIEHGIALNIVPLGVHYEDPTTWQSRVEVVIGKPLDTLPADVAELHRVITTALEDVGANFEDQVSQSIGERLAYAATLGTSDSYAQRLRSFSHYIPPELRAAVQSLEQLSRIQRLCVHQGIPLIPTGSVTEHLWYWLLLLPVIAIFSILNIPALFAAGFASQTIPDDNNVVAFWRMLVGLPVGLFWIILMTLGLLQSPDPAWLFIYWACTLLGIGGWYRFRKLSVALCNALFHGNVRSRLLQAYQTLQNRLQDDRAV